MPNDNVLTIPRYLLQDLIDDVSDYAASREFKTREKAWRDDVLARARALLATPQPEPRAEVTGDTRERRHWNPVYNTDPVQRACAELPEGWGVNACLEREAGWVEVYGPDGEEPDFESDADHFDWQIHEAIDFAIDAARTGASS